MSDKKKKLKDELAKKELEKRYDDAEKLLEDRDKLGEFLNKLEHKLQSIPKIGEQLSHAIVLASMIKSYYKKEYTDIPMCSIIAIVAALIYFVSPVDVIPDTVPGIGHVDDAVVIAFCCHFVDADIKDYIEWRDNNKTE